MGLSNRTSSKWAIVGFFVFISSAAVAEANKLARDPALAPVAHTASLAATVLVWSNWITAILSVPLAIACLLYYAAVLYESKLFARIYEWWKSR